MTSCESLTTSVEREAMHDSVLASREERLRYIGEDSQSRLGRGGWKSSPLTRGTVSVPVVISKIATGVGGL